MTPCVARCEKECHSTRCETAYVSAGSSITENSGLRTNSTPPAPQPRRGSERPGRKHILARGNATSDQISTPPSIAPTAQAIKSGTINRGGETGMSRVVRAFACEFRCGQRVVTSRAAMDRHEQQCIRNPASRSCPTCEHNCHDPSDPPDYETGYPGDPGGYWCYEDHLPKGKRCAKNCEYWTPKQTPNHDQPTRPEDEDAED